MRRVVRAAAATAVALLVVAGCGGGGGDDFTRADLEAGLIAREHFSAETAACISGYLFDQIPVAGLVPLADPDPQGVTPQVWGRYVQTVLACQYHDELGVPAPADQAEPVP